MRAETKSVLLRKAELAQQIRQLTNGKKSPETVIHFWKARRSQASFSSFYFPSRFHEPQDGRCDEQSCRRAKYEAG
jgi:hypothetical protein